MTRYRTRADLRRPSLASRLLAALWRLRRPVAGRLIVPRGSRDPRAVPNG